MSTKKEFQPSPVHYVGYGQLRSACGVSYVHRVSAQRVFRPLFAPPCSGQWQFVTCVNCLRTSVEPGSQVSRSMAMSSVRS